MSVLARLMSASFIAAVSGTCVGLFLAFVAIWIAQANHYGCTRTRIDEQQVWVCPDGIGALFPALAIMALTGIVALMMTTASEFRHATDNDRMKAASLVVTVVGLLLFAQGSVSIPLAITAYSSIATGATITITAAGGALIFLAHEKKATVKAASLATAALLAVCAPGAFLLAPAILIIVGYLLAAATILTVGARSAASPDPR